MHKTTLEAMDAKWQVNFDFVSRELHEIKIKLEEAEKDRNNMQEESRRLKEENRNLKEQLASTVHLEDNKEQEKLQNDLQIVASINADVVTSDVANLVNELVREVDLKREEVSKYNIAVVFSQVESTMERKKHLLLVITHLSLGIYGIK